MFEYVLICYHYYFSIHQKNCVYLIKYQNAQLKYKKHKTNKKKDMSNEDINNKKIKYKDVEEEEEENTDITNSSFIFNNNLKEKKKESQELDEIENFKKLSQNHSLNLRLEKKNLKEFETESKKKQHNSNNKTYINKFWSPLSKDSLNQIEKIFYHTINKLIAKYSNSNKSKISKTIVKTQKELENKWINNENFNSFLSKLKITKLPPEHSVFGKKKDEICDIFNYDQLIQQKKNYQKHFLDELEQLNQLEKYYKSLELTYQLDLKYLNEFKENLEMRTLKDNLKIKEKKKELDITNITQLKVKELQDDDEDIFLKIFDPDKDEETKKILNLLNVQLSTLRNNMDAVEKLNIELDNVYKSYGSFCA